MLVLCASTGQEQSQNGGEQDHLGDADLKFQQQDRGGHANQSRTVTDAACGVRVVGRGQ